jgi:hypothetical protein
MKGTRRSGTNARRYALGVQLVTLAWFFVTTTAAHAQCDTTQAFNTIYGKNTICSSSTTQGSFALVDATQYPAVGSDICGPIQKALVTYANGKSGNQLSGVVVDARGFTSGNLTCTTNPWSGLLPHSNVVLLPAGTIALNQSLVMPVNTRLVGAGSGFPAGAGLTTLTPGSSFPPGADMIDMGMGSSTFCTVNGASFDCEGVVVEHLAIQGVSSGAAAIRNRYSQELSYVNDVVMSGGNGSIGLWLDVHADNSGPYTNIRYSGSGTCAQLYDSTNSFKLRNSRGIHGLTCIMSGGNGPAVYVDAPNNSIEDVSIQGTGLTQEGILIGSRAAAYNNVLLNVTGSDLKNIIHICGLVSSGGCLGSSPANVRDVTVLGATNLSGGGSILVDDLTNTTLSDAHLGMYIVGEPVQANSTVIGYSRFTTSPSVPAWLVGTGQPSGQTCAFGALYSRTSGGTGTGSIYGCTGGGSSPPWSVIK